MSTFEFKATTIFNVFRLKRAPFESTNRCKNKIYSAMVFTIFKVKNILYRGYIYIYIPDIIKICIPFDTVKKLYN